MIHGKKLTPWDIRGKKGATSHQLYIGNVILISILLMLSCSCRVLQKPFVLTFVVVQRFPLLINYIISSDCIHG